MPPPRSERRKFHTNSKRSKKAPQTADDFLEAGIEFEESGDRWRSGDSAKARRFYQRAIESYQTALMTNTRLFDAAYNKARLQYKISQEKHLVPRSDIESILEDSLRGHLECLVLDGDNVDALFNTAQVRTSIAEIMLTRASAGREAEDKAGGISHLEVAVGLFEKCLAIQLEQYRALSTSCTSEDAMDLSDNDDGGEGVLLTQRASAEEYAVIDPPITPSTLLDTLLALLTTLGALYPLIIQPNTNSNEPLLHQIYTLLPLLPERQTEINTAIALYNCALAESRFRQSPTPEAATEWSSTIADSFKFSTTDVSADVLCAKADAHIALAQAIPEFAWRQYAFASSMLGKAVNAIREDDNAKKAEIYLARGDLNMIWSFSASSGAGDEKQRAVLKENAGVYWRYASRVGDPEVMVEAVIKEAVRSGVSNTEIMEKWGGKTNEVLLDAVDEGVFSSSILGMI